MIIWGRKKLTNELGRIADFCAGCRKISAFKFIRVASVGHIYFILLGEGKTVGNQVECENCGSKFVAAATSYKHISTDKTAMLSQLIYETNPDVEKKYANRLLLEEKVRTGIVTADERIKLIREALILGTTVDSLEAKTNSNPGVIVGFILFLAGLLFVFILPAALNKVPLSAILGCIGLAVFGFILVLVSAGRSTKRLSSGKLILTLRPLRPSFSDHQ